MRRLTVSRMLTMPRYVPFCTWPRKAPIWYDIRAPFDSGLSLSGAQVCQPCIW